MTSDFNRSKNFKIFTLLFLLLFSSALLADNDKSVDQSTILQTLANYLQGDFSKIGKEKRTSLAKDFGENGHCAGISIMWLHSKWLQVKQLESNDMYGPVTRIENKEWLQNTIQLIVNWDGKSQLDEKVIADIDTFVKNADYFQNMLGSKQLDKMLNDTNKGRLKKEYSIGSLFTLKQLKQLLKTKDFIQDRKLILVYSHNHATALFKDGENYYYFDPNSSTGEFVTQSTDDVARYIFNANFGFSDCYKKPSPLAFNIFSFDTNNSSYPSPKELLKQINPDLTPEKNYAEKFSGLIIASICGCLECVQYFLEKGVDPNATQEDGYTALMLAAQNGHSDVVKALLADPRTNCPASIIFAGWRQLRLPVS